LQVLNIFNFHWVCWLLVLTVWQQCQVEACALLVATELSPSPLRKTQRGTAGVSSSRPALKGRGTSLPGRGCR